MRSLLWKEWHEQAWKLGFGCIVLAALAAIGLHARIVSDETMAMAVCFVAMVLLPVLASTGLVAAERGEGSFDSLIALPVSPVRILLANTIMGLLLCTGPLLVAAVVSLLATHQREITAGSMIVLYARSALATVALFIWMLALTIRLPTETRAALLATGVLIAWIIATIGLSHNTVPPWLKAISPLASVHGVTDHNEFEPGLLLILLI
jgi:hypothetical protein